MIDLLVEAKRQARLRSSAEHAEQSARDAKRAREISGDKGFLRVVINNGNRGYSDNPDPDKIMVADRENQAVTVPEKRVK